MIWHYAVAKKSPYMKEGEWYWPACRSITKMAMFPDPPKDHAVTKVRHFVTCPECLRLMGAS